ncbi:hypothetical protein BS636_03845 [Acinetobacter sp. LoGeW2-3]|uniref:DUF2147 domain-containing protein n=1 Tax=Acinetobacter sp. LoGeW2-3 TaxID=1808001 RepID=UPI000C05A6CB|nr:DUF2147 domain-containing protein [Acinetobacter sp. LoGeW2-3]ATO18858.1 hypothetical protein BS636_03845 [Acinetobacter sp. LoGeW2-3]
MMKLKLFCSMIFAAAVTISMSVSANNDPLVGKWKTIDDRTGYSLADVIISKDAKDRYIAKIVNVREAPGATRQQNCTQCTGALKDQPLVGLTMLKGLSSHPEHDNEFINGTLLDPVSGQLYQARARLKNNGRHLAIHSRTEGSPVGRNMTWIKN